MTALSWRDALALRYPARATFIPVGLRRSMASSCSMAHSLTASDSPDCVCSCSLAIMPSTDGWENASSSALRIAPVKCVGASEVCLVDCWDRAEAVGGGAE